MLSQASCLPRLGCEGPPCSPMPRSPEECRRLRTCSECLARHPRTLQPGDGEVNGWGGGAQELQLGLGEKSRGRRGARDPEDPAEPMFAHQASAPRCKWCTNCPEGACIGRNGSCTSENDCRINQREVFWAGNCSEAVCGAADCEQCTREGKCMWTRQFKRTGEAGSLPTRTAWGPGFRAPREGWSQGGAGGLDHALIPVPATPGETRRILSVQPTYDWTCFSHSLLNVSPMPVESSPPLPCPTPCHLLPNCTSCLDSKGADGGWQHCVWSSSLQQVPSGRVGGALPAVPLFLCPTSSSVSLAPVPPWCFLSSSPTSSSSFPPGFAGLCVVSARTLPCRHLPDPAARFTVPLSFP